MELWVTWGSQGWAWTPFLLLRALPSPSDKEETDVINEQGGGLEIRGQEEGGLRWRARSLRSVVPGKGARRTWASLSQKNQRLFHCEELGAECLEQRGLTVGKSKEKPGSQDRWACTQLHSLQGEGPGYGGPKGRAKRTRSVPRSTGRQLWPRLTCTLQLRKTRSTVRKGKEPARHTRQAAARRSKRLLTGGHTWDFTGPHAS